MTNAFPIEECRPRTLWEQFACPQGRLGWVVGHLMAWKNGGRSEWVRSLLDVEPADRLLEIGFGPGVDVRWASRRAAYVAGVDRSAVMVRMARSRSRVAVEQGRVRLELGSADDLPFEDCSFDKIYAINSAQFWPRGALAEARRVLKPGGTVYLAVQPRTKGASEATVDETGAALEAGLRAAGFASVRSLKKRMRPLSTVCAIGCKPGVSA